MREVGRGFGRVQVLQDCSFSAGAGEVVALHGANGSGKTTALRIIAGVLSADRGHVAVCGAPPGGGWAAYVPAGDRMLHWRLTGQHDLRFYAALGGAAKERSEAWIEAAVDAVDASELLGRIVGECSTGQRRRLMVAAAMVTGAPVLLLDEPFSDLDRAGKQAISLACASWAAQGGVVMYAAPEPGEGPSPTQALEVVDGRLRRVS